MQIRPDDFMRPWRRARNPAWQLFHVELAVPVMIQRKDLMREGNSNFVLLECKCWWRFIAQLDLTF